MQTIWILESLDEFNEDIELAVELCLVGMRFANLINTVSCEGIF